MIDLPTASAIAAIVAGAVASIDKIYRGYADFFKKKKNVSVDTPPPGLKFLDSPAEGALVAMSAGGPDVLQKVSYEELRAKLEPGDRSHVDALGQALENYEKQWTSAYLAKSMASGQDVARYEAQLEVLARQISDPLLKVLEFVERAGLFLDDHYLAARNIAKEYVKPQSE